ncbi:MAG: protein arginine kinase [Tepidanaerobacter acetatoxydans]|uniref:Protein-arginine kinase n=1 Tax=Tepidanaerobacter acetatoxydans (strain DSM 21804 / JCM 16047 / Re1) TaxID=1209989 RepID=F4LRW4_TEPAE|nr:MULTISPECIES: protein arginine kinase [Tepidanaerobacter]AEE92303.1 ATP:guanido phosphotransferase [Tepidanaerobacter acetatoxydans Re1]NLU11201.1 protein arginine kinase [Tepidanaerobacter acetatoxydans]CCP27184.1 putative ATP:guanido phosphotransferase BBR47_01870 [Tepidanaerobacter acetatoxydans Re1]
MGIENLMEPSNIKWISSPGPDSDIVISSRVRLARNINDIPFPHLLPEQEAKTIIKNVHETLRADANLGQNIELYNMAELPEEHKILLSEMHLISPDLASSKNGAVIVNQDETISIMINEEDHLRIQVMLPGLQLDEAFKEIDKIDDLLEAKLDFAFDEKIGYLTACPTNVGTGMRASVMMHLPVLTMMDQMGQIFATISQVGLVVRGIYGEGSQAKGNLYQISNQITLGKSEEDIIQNVMGVTRQILMSERKIRENLSGEARVRLEDRILRSYGILTNAKIISSQEALAYISDVKLGVDMGIIKDLEPLVLNSLFITTGPAYIQGISNTEMSPVERDLYRADFIRQKIRK